MKFPEIHDHGTYDLKDEYMKLCVLDTKHVDNIFKYWKQQYIKKYTAPLTELDLNRIKEALFYFIPDVDKASVDYEFSQINRIMHNKLHMRDICENLVVNDFSSFADTYFNNKLEIMKKILDTAIGRWNHKSMTHHRVTHRITPDTVVMLKYYRSQQAITKSRGFENTCKQYNVTVIAPSHTTKDENNEAKQS